jgi:PAS domain S-box-containing protein
VDFFITHVIAEDKDSARESVERAYSTGIFNMECRIMVNDSIRWIAAQGKVFRDEHGQPIRMMGTIEDITEHKEEQLAKEHYAAIIASSDDAIYSMDLDGIITSWNDAAARIYGYSRDEIIGKPNALLIPKSHLDEEGTVIQMLMAGGRTEHYETIRLTKPGNLISVSLTASAINDKSGKIVGISKIARDITEQKLAKDAVRSQAELLNLSHDTIMVRDLDGTIRYWNHGAEEMYGFTQQEVIGQISHNLLKTVFPKSLADLEQEILENGRWEGELTRYTKDGRNVVVSSRHSLKRDEQGMPIAVLEINNDISERKKAEQKQLALAEELKRSNTELQQFASVASHDLQEPLRGVTSCLEIIEDTCKDKLDDEDKELFRHAVDGASRMHTLIDDLLSLSRVTTKGRLSRPVDLSTVVERVLENLKFSIKECGATITRDTLPVIGADSTQLNQLFQNLISNAIKFRGSKLPQIHIKAERQDGNWLFAVCDNGIGFEQAYMDKIFLPFQRLHNRGKYPGNGIGLAICKKIVERHGGNIWAESEPGVGTTFYFTMRDQQGNDD